MAEHTLHIKNMVCDRCIMVVKSELELLNIQSEVIRLGEVDLKSALSELQKEQLAARMSALGFELIDDRKLRVIERIKNIIVQLVHQQQDALQINLSEYISQKLGMDYHSLSKIFSEMEGTTIEKYVIAQKIERVKELISYNELNLNEIALLLNYSSTAHLSAQFKKVTGMTASQYKNLADKDRKTLDSL